MGTAARLPHIPFVGATVRLRVGRQAAARALRGTGRGRSRPGSELSQGAVQIKSSHPLGAGEGPERALSPVSAPWLPGRLRGAYGASVGVLGPLLSISRVLLHPPCSRCCTLSHHYIPLSWVIEGKRHHLCDLPSGRLDQASPPGKDIVGRWGERRP